MISRFGLLTRNPKLSPEEFDRHWRISHGPLAAKFPGLRAYYQHLVVNKEQFGIDHARGSWNLDGFSELHFDNIDDMMSAVSSPAFSGALQDEVDFLQDVHLVACEKHVVVPLNLGNGPFVKRMTLLKRLPEVSVEQFRREWLNVHASWVRQWPNVLGYVQNVVVDRYHGKRTISASYEEVPIDGIVEFWFRDKQEAAALYASDIVAQTQKHALVFLDEITPYFVETRQIV
ncbi:EthD domain-containing protein [Mesorhizobium sp. DCY119]|uniref:EthD domain-containing protein n=1 Tax=Mesorhizobium sp. DCY119 TaxID=2108445 RepID=UPI000E6B53DD|nr:EthD domain-containing protein [Mesorhizobium sp. DCY119]RJG46169.1 EthD family reductase [Mesorhizobium sp. DCY119]